jgi:predicted 3-demethylubiquinone-9 3-methyltransferase (glyoxalase superfamily)
MPMIALQKIRTCLWFDHQAEEATNFYISLFPGQHNLEGNYQSFPMW